MKVTGFFEHIPVRKQTAIQHASKLLAKIRRLMQAYALARPVVRFRLHVLKARNNKIDLHYVPNSKASIEDAAFKVIGKDCALQCDWTTLELDNFEIQAFLPKPTANASRIANVGAFVSIDTRPVSNMRGTVKKMLSTFKTRLRKVNSPLAYVKEPFIYVNVTCPPDSYDPNIEPAKDDVMFENEDVVLGTFDRLMRSYYSEDAACPEGDIIPTSAQQSPISRAEKFPAQIQTPAQRDRDYAYELHGLPRWRSSMYGIDEDDMQIIQDEQPLAVEDEVCMRDLEVSNPWTIARMNAAVKTGRFSASTQLLSPAKTQHDVSPQSSPILVETPRRNLPLDPLTPQSIEKLNCSSLLDEELMRSIQRAVPFSSTRKMCGSDHMEGRVPLQNTSNLTQANRYDYQTLETDSFQDEEINSTPQISRIPMSSAPRRSQHRQRQAYVNKPFVPPAANINDTWFGQPMRGSGSQKATSSKGHPKTQDIVPFTSSSIPSSPRRRVPNTAERTMKKTLHSGSNTDIRGFYRSSESLKRTLPAPSLTSVIHTEAQEEVQNPEHQLRAYAEARASPPRPSSTSATSMLFNAQDTHSDSNYTSLERSPSSSSASHPHTNPPTRTKSSTLPLERTPPGSQTHSIIYMLKTSIKYIVQRACSLDMQRDSLAWGHRFPSATAMPSAFAAPVSARRVVQWVAVMGQVLGARYECVGHVDVEGVLGAGVREAVRKCGQVDCARGHDDGDDQQAGGCDESPHADSDIDASSAPWVAGTMDEQNATTSGGELADEIEDDMLLDL